MPPPSYSSSFPFSLEPYHADSYLTSCLQEGDLILTGTPSGVGPLKAGDDVECLLSDGSGKELATLTFGTVDRSGGYHYQASS